MVEYNESKGTYKITCCDNQVETKFYVPITESHREELKREFYEKPTLNEVKKQFKSIAQGNVVNDKVTNYYVKDLMSKTKVYTSKWSIEEVFDNAELLGIFVGKVQCNDVVFPTECSEISNVESAIRLGGKGIAQKVANFPIKTVDEILRKYNVNDNYYDFSCGWGARLLGSLKNNINYFGTDVNYLLTQRLNQMVCDYKSCVYNTCEVDIRTQGSEIFVPQWENKIGLAFSSPPYFCLEDYQIGNQSYKQGTTYESWLENYLRPTFENIYKYLIDEGYFVINIKDFSNYELEKDTKRIAEESGFELLKIERLENIKRQTSNEEDIDNDENIYVFTKKGMFDNKQYQVYDRQLMFF